jgi:agmatinase
MTSPPSATKPAARPLGDRADLTELAARKLNGRWCVLGVPVSYDCQQLETPSAGPAAMRGALPYFSAHRAASGRAASGQRTFWDWSAQRQLDLAALAPLDVGDLRYDRRTDTAVAVEDRIRLAVEAICGAGGRPLVLGGEHWLTLPVIQALSTRNADISVIHFDAHTDRYTTDRAASVTVNNGNVMRFVAAERGVRHLLQIGVRELDAAMPSGPSPSQPSAITRTVSAREAIARPATEIFEGLPPDGPVYLTVDADVLDPAYAPEVGWPVMGGLSLRELMDLVEYAIASFRLIGADLVEVTGGTGRMNLAAMAMARCALLVICSAAAGGPASPRLPGQSGAATS